MDDKELLQAIFQELKEVKGTVQGMDQRITKIEVTQENVTNRNIQVLLEGMHGMNEKFQRLDDLEEKVEDIQITVSVLKALTVKK